MNKEKVAVTVMRLVLGVIFLLHGLQKVNMGLDQVATNFGNMGFPSFLGYAVAIGEVLGGLGLILGLLTRIAAGGMAAIMIGVLLFVKLGNGITGQGGIEFDLTLLAMALFHVITGQVGLGLDNFFGKNKASVSARQA